MTLIVNVKESSTGVLLIVTDKEILGKKFEEGKKQLDLTSDFYKGEEKSKEEVKKMIIESRHVHLTGKESVAIGVEMDFVNPEHILYVQNVPHAEVVMGD